MLEHFVEHKPFISEESLKNNNSKIYKFIKHFQYDFRLIDNAKGEAFAGAVKVDQEGSAEEGKYLQSVSWDQKDLNIYNLPNFNPSKCYIIVRYQSPKYENGF